MTVMIDDLPNADVIATCNKTKPGTEWVQALADISRSALCCYSKETRAPIANPPNSAQLQGTSYYSTNLHLGPRSSVGMRRGTDRHTDTQTAVTNIHFASATAHGKCNKSSAVAEMGDLFATIDIRHGPKSGGCCAPFRRGLGPHLTQCSLGRGLPSYWRC